MKKLDLWFEDEEFEYLKKEKERSELTWKEFILQLKGEEKTNEDKRSDGSD